MHIKELTKKYGHKTVLDHISLEIPQGKVVGLVGENGAGKTTFFRCIMGMENYDGDILYGEHIIKNITGFLPTTPIMLPYITAKEYLQFICQAQGTKDIDVVSKNIFGLPLNEYASHFSTGMKKKLALTGILLVEKACYILDEPFNGVDINSNLMIKAIIEELKKRGKTILIASHLFESLYDLCDVLLFLENGTLSTKSNKKEFKDVEDVLIAKAKTQLVGKLWD